MVLFPLGEGGTMPGLTGRIIQGKRGKYKIIKRLGQGGMGIVYLAEDLAKNEPVAIKRLPASMSQDSAYVRALEREWRAITQFSHPNIVRPVDAFRLGDEYFLVMEYVEGRTLEEMVVKRKGPLPIKNAVYYVLQAAKALSYLHQHHFIHRDVSPSNIMVSKDGLVKLTDFGLAHSANEMTDVVDRGRFKKFNVTAPELFQNELSTPAADVYSLAATLFRVLTGRYPFIADSPAVIMHKHINEPPPDPRRFNPRIPKSVAAVILKGLAKDPNERYPTATEFGAALEEAFQQPSSGKPMSHKNMSLVTGMTLGLFVAVVFIALIWQRQGSQHPSPRVVPPMATATVTATPLPSPPATSSRSAAITDTPVPTPVNTVPPTPEPTNKPAPPSKAPKVVQCSYPYLHITSPAIDEEVHRQQPLVVQGTASVGPERPAFSYYKIEVQSPTGGWILGYRGDRPHTQNSVLGTLDFVHHPDLRNLGAGWYRVRLMVVDASGNYPPPCSVTIHLVSP